MNNTLVFGGNGFLGSYVVEELLSRKYNVTVADISSSNVNNSVKFIKVDISSDKDLEKVFSKNFDFVFNLAGLADLDKAIDNPVKSFQLNTISNLKILFGCVSSGVKQFVYASSAYAASKKGSFYGISKLTSEKIIEEFNKKYGLNYTILRYGSVYSDRSFENNYIYNLIEKIYSSDTIDHHGDGSELREYIHAADAANMTVDTIEKKDYKNQSFILTGIEQIRRNDLFQMIKEIIGKDFIVKYSNKKQNNHYSLTPYSFEPSVAKKLISNPQIDLGQGLLSCVRSVWRNKKNEKH